MIKHPDNLPPAARLRRRAENQLRNLHRHHRSKAGPAKTAADPRRLLHELQVHQVELEMQNAELQASRDRMESLLEKFTDLYDFAPVGYFSLDEAGRILEVNLMGAAMLGVERSRLIHQPLLRFVTAASQPAFLAFLKRVFAGNGKQVCEVVLSKAGGVNVWVSLHGAFAISVSEPGKWCRVAVTDISSVKQAEEGQRRLEIAAAANLKLRREIIRRQAVERSLQNSKRHQGRLLQQSRRMQEQLRQLSRQVLQAQEEERKRISRELHDVIAQTLTGINIRLATLAREAATNTRGLDRNIARTQRLVEKSVDIVHRFARDLRPAGLDDLGLIPALHSFVKVFFKRTRIRVHLKAFAAVEQLDTARRTVLFRVAQEALTNVARHAHASRVEVSIQKLPDGICMKIIDDGKSFQADRVLHGKGSKRLGLLGMRERMEMVGGHFGVESVQGIGTTIIAQFPNGKAAGGGHKSSPLKSNLEFL